MTWTADSTCNKLASSMSFVTAESCFRCSCSAVHLLTTVNLWTFLHFILKAIKKCLSFRCVLKHGPQWKKFRVCPNTCRHFLQVPRVRRKLRRRLPNISTTEPGELARGVSVSPMRPSVDVASSKSVYSTGQMAVDSRCEHSSGELDFYFECRLKRLFQEKPPQHLRHTVCCVQTCAAAFFLFFC